VAAFLLVVMFALAFFSARRWSPTYDEPAHLEYGEGILQGSAERFDDSKMPFSALNALVPWMAERLQPGLALETDEAVGLGRTATILFAILVAWIVYRWGREMYGVWPALFSLFLFVFEPNLLAHSALVTTDFYAAGMVLACVYALWLYTRRRSITNACLLGAVLGLSQMAKYTCIALYPLLAFMLLAHDAPTLAWIFRGRDWAGLRRYAGQLLVLGSIAAVLGLLIINLGFLFDRTFTPLGEYAFRSELFQKIQIYFPRLVVPAPYPYLEGLDWVRFNERTGGNFSRVYLLGRLSETGFPGYYLIAFLFKVPLAVQVAIALSGLKYILDRRAGLPQARRFWQDEWFLLAPVLFFGVYFNYFYRAQIGIRFYLVVFPFLLLFAGRLLLGWRDFTRRGRLGIAALGAFLVVSTLSYFPHWLAYFNELVPDRRLAYRILADSNLDWGQAGEEFERYYARHPELVVDPEEITAGRVAVGASSLVGVTAKPQTYAWLRENFTPNETVAYAVLIFDISQEEAARVRAGADSPVK
jgi:hypothetical protein